MTDNEFRLLRDMIHRECGISLREDKKDFLMSRAERIAKGFGMRSYYDLYRYLSDAGNKERLHEFIDVVTVNETRFFRNNNQYELFAKKILPEIIESKRKNREYHLNLWSAGCATGEEPYSLAIGIHEALRDLALWKVKIMASDISLQCLDKANKGVYLKEKLRDVPPEVLRHFNLNGNYCSVKEHIKKIIVFDFHNLMHDNGLSGMDVIFCKNVMIYFDNAERERLLSRFARVLKPGGYLFIGHAETLNGSSISKEFKFVYHNKGTAYQKAGK